MGILEKINSARINNTKCEGIYFLVELLKQRAVICGECGSDDITLKVSRYDETDTWIVEYICNKCGHIDDERHEKEEQGTNFDDTEKKLCDECKPDPEWHERMHREYYDKYYKAVAVIDILLEKIMKGK